MGTLPVPGMSTRTFEMKEGRSTRFWSIALEGNAHVVRAGRAGTAGRPQTRNFASAKEARKAFEEQIRERLREGYVEVIEAARSTPEKSKGRDKPARGKARPEPAQPPAPAAKRPPPIPLPEGLERGIDLDPQDWELVFWRPIPYRPLPEPRPFDLQACLERLDKVQMLDTGERHRPSLELPAAISREEAHFWFTAVTNAWEWGWVGLADRLAKKRYDGKVSFEMAQEALEEGSVYISAEFASVLANLLSFEEVLALALDEEPFRQFRVADRFYRGLRLYVLPHLLPARVERFREEVRARIRTLKWPALPRESRRFGLLDLEDPSPLFFLAAYLGLSDELRPIVRAWPDDLLRYPGLFEWHPELIVFGLGNEEEVEREVRRLGFGMSPRRARLWLANTWYRGLDYLADALVASSREGGTELFQVLKLVRAPEVAPQMLRLKRESRVSKLAAKWLEDHPDYAAAGLVPEALRTGPEADAALEYLRGVYQAGERAPVEAALALQSPEEAERLRALLSETRKEAPTLGAVPAWFKAVKPPADEPVPAWAKTVAENKPILVGEKRLPDPQAQQAIAALRRSTLDAPHPLAAAVKKNAEADSLGAVAWKLFVAWRENGAPDSEQWALLATGLWGTDRTALKLAPVVREWGKVGQAHRAMLGLECLRAIGTDAALMQLHAISQKAELKGLKHRAANLVEALAKERALTRVQLEDRTVPDCDLDPTGARVLDFGGRQFHVVLGPGLEPMIRDSEGELHAELPKPTAKDDATRAGVAMMEWRLLRSPLRDAARQQAERLEQAMVTGRRWSPREFEQLIVNHPLLTHLARLIVWGGYDPKGRLKATFRVTAERTYADAKGKPCAIGGLEEVGVVHPMQLSREQQEAWRKLMAEQGPQPFPQLGRTVQALEKGEEKAQELTRWRGRQLAAPTLVGGLERRAWVPGVPRDGAFREHLKHFPGADVTAVVRYTGVAVGAPPAGSESQEIESCVILPGLVRPEALAGGPEPLKLGSAPPAVVSEVLAELAALVERASV